MGSKVWKEGKINYFLLLWQFPGRGGLELEKEKSFKLDKNLELCDYDSGMDMRITKICIFFLK